MSKRIPLPSKEDNSSDASSILNIFSAIAALIVTAIFFIAGWVYESYWYGFYGISLSQINIQPQEVMIEGVPGILLISLPIFIIIAFVVFTEKSAKEGAVSSYKNRLGTIPQIILLSFYFASGIFWVIALLNYRFISPMPVEILISVTGMIVITIATFSLILLLNFRNYLDLQKKVLTGYSDTLMASFGFVVAQILKSFGLSSVYTLPIAILAAILGKVIIDSAIKRTTQQQNSSAKSKDNKLRTSKIIDVFVTSWKAWIGIVLLFLLFISVGMSALLGRIDAHYGRRMMMGGWKMEETYIYSSKSSDIPLPHSSALYSAKGYAYGPFGLIANDDQVYYLVDWMVGNYYHSRPNLYTIPRSNDTSLIILYAPQPTPTPTPIPTLTVTPTPTLTAIPLPITATPTP